MKVGLLSYHKNYNYGWNLQCYALMTVIKSLGHEVTYIDKRKFEPSSRFIPRIKRTIRYILEQIHVLSRSLTYEEYQSMKGNNIQPFFNDRIIPRTLPIHSERELLNLPHFEAIVVGSDQCWRSMLVCPIENYFLDFVNYPCKKIAYAASFGSGNAEYTEDEIKKCGELIKQFDAVSVRENEGVLLIKEKYRWSCIPCQMPDPTLLLSSIDYYNLIPQTLLSKEPKGIFAYLLDKSDDKEDCLDFIEQQYKLDSFSIDLAPSTLEPIPSVEKWLSNFANANFIFTDSFHGVVFSLIFRKPFLVYANKARGLSRFITILSMFDMQDRLIYSSDDISKDYVKQKRFINTSLIDNKHVVIRHKGIDFLKRNLAR